MPMSSFPHFLRDFAVCAALSFLIILGAIHALQHLLHIYCVSSLALHRHMPLVTILTEPAVQLALLAEANTYFFVVFKVTVACTVLWAKSREQDAEAGDVDADRKAPVPQELGWRRVEEKHVVLRDFGYLAPIPEVDETAELTPSLIFFPNRYLSLSLPYPPLWSILCAPFHLNAVALEASIISTSSLGLPHCFHPKSANGSGIETSS
ncbi:hypothetical protein B0H17DRAFT_1216646 [Mycena rosella]|uniref:Uncharacterized protein n=1 Tax=Mycena rosella TaxID=1033263 RepID=A0AAD7C691_MYCRO|nr:hypothetical protein B0H17DRAFT_1216646 [Mycena rosella]